MRLFAQKNRRYTRFLMFISLSLITLQMPASALPEIDTLWDYDRPALSERRFRDLLSDTQGDEDYHLQLQTQLARALGLQRKLSAAHMLLDDVSYHLPPEPCIARLRYMLERGRLFNTSHEQERALPLFESALKLSLQMKADFYAVDAAHMLAIASPLHKQLGWNQQAMLIAESSRDERAQKWLGSLYNNMGWTYHDQGHYQEALEMFEKALAWHTEHKTGNGELIAEWSVARALRSLGKVEEALKRQQALYQTRQTLNLTEDGYVSEEIAECLLSLGRTEEAAPHFAKAWELLSQDRWLLRNETERLQRLKQLGGQ